jgi:hypothetical protein
MCTPIRPGEKGRGAGPRTDDARGLADVGGVDHRLVLVRDGRRVVQH